MQGAFGFHNCTPRSFRSAQVGMVWEKAALMRPPNRQEHRKGTTTPATLATYASRPTGHHNLLYHLHQTKTHFTGGDCFRINYYN